MHIVGQPIPVTTTKVILASQVVSGAPVLAIRIAEIIAVWGSIEAQLEALLVQACADAYETKLSEFRKLRGWHLRAEMIRDAVDEHSSPDDACLLRALLNFAAAPANKRHDVAHGVWAQVEGRNDALALFPETLFTHVAEMAVQMRRDGATNATPDLAQMLSTGLLITEPDLTVVRDELCEVYSLLHSFRMLAFPTGADQTCNSFQDQRASIVNHRHIRDRLRSVRKSRGLPLDDPTASIANRPVPGRTRIVTGADRNGG